MFFLWGYIKDMVFVSPLATSMDDLKSRITAAMNLLDKLFSQTQKPPTYFRYVDNTFAIFPHETEAD